MNKFKQMIISKDIRYFRGFTFNQSQQSAIETFILCLMPQLTIKHNHLIKRENLDRNRLKCVSYSANDEEETFAIIILHYQGKSSRSVSRLKKDKV